MHAILLLSAALIGQQTPPLIDIGRDIFALEDKAYLVMPPVSVAPDVQECKWSPDGRTVLFMTSDPEPEIDRALSALIGREVKPDLPEIRVGFYLVSGQRTRWVTGLPRNVFPQSISWIGSSSALFDAVRYDLAEDGSAHMTSELYYTNSGTGKAIRLGAMPGNQYFTVIAEPATEMAFILSARKDNQGITKWEAFQATADGKLLPASSKVVQNLNAGWFPRRTIRGQGIVFAKFGPDQTGGLLLTPKGDFEPTNTQEFMRSSIEPVQGMALNQMPGPLGSMLVLYSTLRKAGEQANERPVNLCMQVETSDLSPTLSGVAYTSQRMLWVRSFSPISLEAYHHALEVRRRTEAMSRAKQVGTAIMIYGADHDDAFPTGDPVEALRPYMKNDKMFEGYVFTFPNVKSMNDIENVTTTEIGYIPLPGGRVVTYADSSVRWVPDK